MKRNIKLLTLFSVAIIFLLITLMKVDAARTENPVSLTISAAASLKEVVQEIAKAYKKEKPNVMLNLNFGSSGTLQKQIEQGAPVDIFISAGEKQMGALKEKKLIIDSTYKKLLLNEVVLIAPIDSTIKIKGFKDAVNEDIKHVALGEPKSVPCGQYAEEVFKNLNILDGVKSKAVYGKDVREILTWVEQGNADLGVTYKTDALTSNKVKIIETAEAKLHSPIVYPGAVIKASKNMTEAQNFLKYLSGKLALTLFEKYGFVIAK